MGFMEVKKLLEKVVVFDLVLLQSAAWLSWIGSGIGNGGMGNDV
jgi:hypothetical protein